ncbi:hypothetical protein COOONC_08143 [Cooperia oncophora]
MPSSNPFPFAFFGVCGLSSVQSGVLFSIGLDVLDGAAEGASLRALFVRRGNHVPAVARAQDLVTASAAVRHRVLHPALAKK